MTEEVLTADGERYLIELEQMLQQVADECYRQFDKSEATGS